MSYSLNLSLTANSRFLRAAALNSSISQTFSQKESLIAFETLFLYP